MDETGCYQLSYIDPTTDTATQLIIAQDVVTLIRTGENNFQQVYNATTTTQSEMITPHGVLTMCVQTEKLHVACTDIAGVVDVVYNLYLSDVFAGKFVVRIEYRED